MKKTHILETDLKTLNGESLLGNGNIDLEGLSTMSNPIMNQEVLTEHRCPLNGKRRWMKLIDFGSLPNATTKSVNHGVNGMENPQLDWENSKVVNSGNTYFSMQYATSNGIHAWRTNISNGAVSITTYSDRREYTATVCILYTKASDTIEDPVRLVGGGFKFTESDVEPDNPSLGDEWHNTTDDIIYKRRKKNGILGWYET